MPSDGGEHMGEKEINRTLKNMLSEVGEGELYDKIEESNIDNGYFLHIYHHNDRDRDRWVSILKKWFSDKNKLRKNIDEVIELGKKERKNFLKLKMALLKESERWKDKMDKIEKEEA